MRTLARRAFAFYWGTGIADDVPALTYYLVLSLAPVALGLAALEALLLSDTQAGASTSPTASTASCPTPRTRDIRHLVLGTRDNSPVLLAIALATMLWTTSGAIGVIERCESRILDCERHDIVTGRLRNMALGAGHRDHGPRGERRRAGHRRRRRRAERPAHAAGQRCSSSSTRSARSSSSRCSTTGRRARGRNWRACLLGAVPAGIAIQAVPSIVGLYFGAGAGFAAVRLFLLLAVIIAGLYIIALVTLVGGSRPESRVGRSYELPGAPGIGSGPSLDRAHVLRQRRRPHPPRRQDRRHHRLRLPRPRPRPEPPRLRRQRRRRPAPGRQELRPGDRATASRSAASPTPPSAATSS